MMKVLVAVDGSSHADKAVDHVIRLASELRSIEVLLVNVQPDPEFRTLAMYREEMLAELRENGEAALAGARDRFRAAGVSARERLEIGDPPHMIADIAAAENVDLVVLGTMGLGSAAGLLLCTVAMKVLHLVEVPVTLVR
ncbi:universal stress protein [Pinisolibacter sp.]|mgnify:FL=1|uniref:universal stress protein n=1 Tax=Pinisolibacter sp. TaxID=2172024 RepID=UPI002FDCD8C3